MIIFGLSTGELQIHQTNLVDRNECEFLANNLNAGMKPKFADNQNIDENFEFAPKKDTDDKILGTFFCVPHEFINDPIKFEKMFDV